MEHEEEEDQEIGIKQEGGAAATEEKKEGADAQTAEAQNEGGKPYPRKRKDYGKDYDPNYKKKNWRKGQLPQALTEEQKKNLPPAQPRTKTERGDYVVTSFQIPDRVSDTKAKSNVAGEVEEKKKKRRVGAFQIDDSDLEEETEEATQASTEAVVAQEEVKEQPTPVVQAAPTKILSKKEQKKKEMEELEALLGNITPAAVTSE